MSNFVNGENFCENGLVCLGKISFNSTFKLKLTGVKMNNNTKDQPGCDVICQRSHTANRDVYRVCPSKLSKRELENLYFSLLENNLELKKTLHSQTEKLKLLSTKVQRMTVMQRNAAGKEKDCCTSKVLVGEQKDIIADLKRANEQMSDRIRLLNMRLCSAKQFLKRSAGPGIRCPKCGICPVLSNNDPNPDTKNTNKQTRTVETETDQKETESAEKDCNENKCRTVMDELKQKIANLQEELSKTHDEYCQRISKLEDAMSRLHRENVSVRAERESSEHALHDSQAKADTLRAELRRAEGTVNELTMQLTIERRKVKELETALKLASKPSDVSNILQKINASQESKVNVEARRVAVSTVGPSASATSYYSTKQDLMDAPSPIMSKSEQLSPAAGHYKDMSKSDDSGCADLNKTIDTDDTKVQTHLVERMNREMSRKISELQSQLDSLRVKGGAQTLRIERLQSDLEICNDDDKQLAIITVLEDRPNAVLEIQELCVKDVSKPERDINTSTPVRAPVKIVECEPSTSSKVDPGATRSWNDFISGNTMKNEDNFLSGVNIQNTGANGSNIDETGKNGPKYDDCRYQIPGPIPTCETFRNKKPCKLCKTCTQDKQTDKKIVCDSKGVKIDSDRISAEQKTDAKAIALASPPILISSPIKQDSGRLSPKITIVEPFKNIGGQKATRNSGIDIQKLKESDENQRECVENQRKSDENKRSTDTPKLKESDENKLSDDFSEDLDIFAVDSLTLGQERLTKDKAIAEDEENPQEKPNKVSDELAKVRKLSAMSLISRGDTVVTPPPSLASQDDYKSWKTLEAGTSKTGTVKIDVDNVREEERTEEFEQCVSKVTICRCPKSARREVNVFRTCSGTLRFHATAVGDHFKQCTVCLDGNEAIATGTDIQAEPQWSTQQSKITPPPSMAPAEEGIPRISELPTLIPRAVGVLQITPAPADQENVPVHTVPAEMAQKVASRRDSATFTAIPPTTRRDSATFTTMPQPARRDSATFTTIPAPARRDSATFTAMPPPARRDSATFTTMPPPARRDSATFTTMPPPTRRDSATFTAMPPPTRRDSATFTAMPVRRDSATFTKNCIDNNNECECKCSRSTSPDNTEREISSLSDLPPERDVKPYPGRSRRVSSVNYSPSHYPSSASPSPGEQRGGVPGTCTDTDTRSTDYGGLSDGEIPIYAHNKPRTLSFGEKPTCNVHRLSQGSERQMEATLNAISEELAHCRKLLAAAREHEISESGCMEAPGSSEEAPGPCQKAQGPCQKASERVHKLHAAANSRRLPDTAPNTAVFTIHIGTLVLSDEAVVRSRNKSLCLSWQFYDQPTAMTRMRAGRVVLFDFSTEYDVAFTDDFLAYMKQEEMVISICEMGAPEAAVAVCSLPLRDVLIHTNRRADMSLALVAGDATRAWTGEGKAAGVDPLVAGDELGVLDLWCSLRVPPRLRAAISAFSDYPVEANRKRRASSIKSLGHSELVNSKTQADFEPKWQSSAQTRHRSSGTIANEVSANIRSPGEMKQALEDISQAHSSLSSLRNVSEKQRMQKKTSTDIKGMRVPDGLQDLLNAERKMSTAAAGARQRGRRAPSIQTSRDEDPDPAVTKKYTNGFNKHMGLNKVVEVSKKTVTYTDEPTPPETQIKDSVDESQQSIDITVLWLALNEECEAMVNPQVHRVYVAYSFLGRRGADLETPVSLPKPKHYADKCYFNFKKTLQLHDAELPLLGHMARCRAGAGAGRSAPDPRDCLVFSVVSEPAEDPLGLSSCEDIGYAYLYLGDILAYSGGGAGYTEVLPVRAAGAGTGSPPTGAGAVCGVLAVRVDGLSVLRRCLSLSHSSRDLAQIPS